MTSSMLRRQLKNLVQNYSEAEVKVREATSNDPWGPSNSQMADISDLTYNVVACNEIMTMLWKRLKDDRNWRHIHKSLTLLEYLLKTGDDRVLLKMKDNIYIVKALTEYRFVEKDGKDQGTNVREKAKVVLVLMEDDEKLKTEREFALKTREKTSNSSAASSTEAVKDPNYKPCYVVGASGLPSLDNIPSVADLTASFAARKEERLKQEAEKKEADRRAKLTEDELQWEDAGRGNNTKGGAWAGDKAEEEEAETDSWGSPKEPKEATDPWGTPARPDTAAATSDSWGALSKTDEDPFAAPKNGEDPFAAQENESNSFSTSKDDPFNAPKDEPSPFSAARDKEDPFAAPKDKPDPFSLSTRDPFNAPKEDPFNAPKEDPFNTPKDDPFNAPRDGLFHAPKDGPFNPPKDDPFNTLKEDPFNDPKDDPFNDPKDNLFTAPKDDPFNASKEDSLVVSKDDPFNTPKDDPFNTPQEDPFTAPTSPTTVYPFAAPFTKDDPFAEPTTPPKDVPFSAPSTKEDAFSATALSKEDPFAEPSSPPKHDASDPFNAPPVSSAQGRGVWGVSSTSPPATGSDPWGNGTSASSATDNSDPFGDASKPDNDPWGAPAPASTNDAWGSQALLPDSSPSSDPFGDEASKKGDPWGAQSNAPSNGTGKPNTREGDIYTKTATFLGSAGASLVDLDDLFSSNTKPKQFPLVNKLVTQPSAFGAFKARAHFPETSAPHCSNFGSMFLPSFDATSPILGADNLPGETPLFQLLSHTVVSSHSGINMPQVAPPHSGTVISPVGARPPVGFSMNPLCEGAGMVQSGSLVGNPFGDPLPVGTNMGQLSYFGENRQVGVGSSLKAEGRAPFHPEWFPGLSKTVNKNNNPFLP